MFQHTYDILTGLTTNLSGGLDTLVDLRRGWAGFGEAVIGVETEIGIWEDSLMTDGSGAFWGLGIGGDEDEDDRDDVLGI